MPQVSGWAPPSSGAKCEGWKAGALPWDVLPAGEKDRVVKHCNSLLREVVDASSLEGF